MFNSGADAISLTILECYFVLFTNSLFFFEQATDGADKIVAVKVFNSMDHASWKTEKEVYLLPQMKHPNILTFLGSDNKVEGITISLWLITEYHPLGSLFDYLKSHTINLKEFLTIFIGIARGESYSI